MALSKEIVVQKLIEAGLSKNEIELFLESYKNDAINKQKYLSGSLGLVWEENKETEETLASKLEKEYPAFIPLSDMHIHNNPDNPNNVNLLFEGDNLYALAAMQFTHIDENGKGLIDVITIDPPYGTGKSFRYNDKWVDETDNYRHSKWLSFMDKRLRLAQNLLSDNGVMFININDNEQANLKLLCDKIFDEENVEIIIWHKMLDEGTAGKGKMKITYRCRLDHEYIIVCYKNKKNTLFNKPLKMPSWKTNYPNKDNDPRGPWCDGELCKSQEKSNPDGKNYYSITSPSGKTVFTRQWHCSKEEFEAYLKDTRITPEGKIVSRIWWGADGEKCPRLKKFQFLPAPTTPTSVIRNISQTEGNDDFKKIFQNTEEFDNPKPVSLIKELINLVNKKNALVLDFFAGSGTTGQAVLELNQEDGGNRNFILCTNNEIDDVVLSRWIEKHLGKAPTKEKGNDLYQVQKEILIKQYQNTDEYKQMGIFYGITYPRLKTIITGIRPDKTQYCKENLIEETILYSQTLQLSDLKEINKKTNIELNIKKYLEEAETIQKNNKNIFDSVSIIFDNGRILVKGQNIKKSDNKHKINLNCYHIDSVVKSNSWKNKEILAKQICEYVQFKENAYIEINDIPELKHYCSDNNDIYICTDLLMTETQLKQLLKDKKGILYAVPTDLHIDNFTVKPFPKIVTDILNKTRKEYE